MCRLRLRCCTFNHNFVLKAVKPIKRITCRTLAYACGGVRTVCECVQVQRWLRGDCPTLHGLAADAGRRTHPELTPSHNLRRDHGGVLNVIIDHQSVRNARASRRCSEQPTKAYRAATRARLQRAPGTSPNRVWDHKKLFPLGFLQQPALIYHTNCIVAQRERLVGELPPLAKV